ncbi:MAG TPA: flagellar basal body rod protein FlgC [Gammaproteobacteria bacterium]|nr:flagellar basal body rod protein FlgC [Gammaproteobacteria bacterium]
MSLFNVFDISGSAMGAQSLRMNLTASNLANADTVSGDEKNAYSSRQPVFSSIMNSMGNDSTASGVKMVAVVESQAKHNKRYEPGNPMANKEGYVFDSNVNIIEEMTNMISASRNYQNNVEIINTSKDMLMKTLKLGNG